MASKKKLRNPSHKARFSWRTIGNIFTKLAMAARSIVLRPTWILLTFVLLSTCYIYISTSSSTHPGENPIQIPSTQSKSIPKIQFDFPHLDPKKLDKVEILPYNQNLQHLEAVKQTFLRSWNGYRNHAWGADFLLPISGMRGGSTYVMKDYRFAVTLVEALDTLIILGLSDEVEEAVELVGRLNFTRSDERIVEIFEVARSVLGGLIAAYDLSNGNYPVLLVKAVELGDFLMGSFDTVNKMPVTRWEWKRTRADKQQNAFDDMILSELGGMTLEFTRLTQLSGDSKFFDAVQRIQDMLENHQDLTQLPGMWPIVVDATGQGKFDLHNSFTLGLMADSVYAVLPKQNLQLGGHSDRLGKMYAKAITAAQKFTIFKPMTMDNRDILFSSLTRVVSPGVTSLDPQIHQQDCAIGGMVALASKVFNRPEDLEMAKKLVDGCIWASEVFPSGLMPETFYVVPCEKGGDCLWDESVYLNAVVARDENITLETVHVAIEYLKLQPGIVDLMDVRALLRPELIESIFILYRITGEQKYRDAAWKIFEALDFHTRTEYGNAALKDMSDSFEKTDLMGSYWMGATLKYFYLIFSEPDVVSLDDFVFNTVGHPFRRPG